MSHFFASLTQHGTVFAVSVHSLRRASTAVPKCAKRIGKNNELHENLKSGPLWVSATLGCRSEPHHFTRSALRCDGFYCAAVAGLALVSLSDYLLFVYS